MHVCESVVVCESGSLEDCLVGKSVTVLREAILQEMAIKMRKVHILGSKNYLALLILVGYKAFIKF